MKKRHIAILCSLGVIVTAYYMFSKDNHQIVTSQSSVDEKKEQMSQMRSRSSASTNQGDQGDSRAIPEAGNDSDNDFSQLRNQEIALEFSRILIKYPEMKKYYEHLAYLGSGPDAQMARVWISMGLVIAPAPDEGVLLSKILAEVAAYSGEMMNVLEAKQTEIEEDTGFTEQLVLPLVHTLNVPVERKVSFYGNVIDNPVEFSPDGSITAKTANITNALIYMKQANAPFSVVEPQLIKAVQANRSDVRGNQELMVRVTAYFPEFKEN